MASNEASFTIGVDGASGEQYRGTFKMKIRLGHRDTLRQDAFRRDLLGPSPEGQLPNKDAAATSQVFSKIWTHLIDAPDWWKAQGNGLDLLDEEPIMEVLKQIQDREREALKALKKEGEDAKKELQEEVKKEA